MVAEYSAKIEKWRKTTMAHEGLVERRARGANKRDEDFIDGKCTGFFHTRISFFLQYFNSCSIIFHFVIHI
jgi:hypothetical protein